MTPLIFYSFKISIIFLLYFEVFASHLLCAVIQSCAAYFLFFKVSYEAIIQTVFTKNKSRCVQENFYFWVKTLLNEKP